AGLGLGARQVNESAYQDDVVNAQNTYGIRNNAYQQAVGNASNQYATRYRTYRDAVDDKFRLSQLGFNATTAGRY
ncbi:MAG: hypothetical protein M3Q55_02590, partial [Acidobacteriota bacterium]|nr:hypothetical protein [Acidobacteriota bacterium]